MHRTPPRRSQRIQEGAKARTSSMPETNTEISDRSASATARQRQTTVVAGTNETFVVPSLTRNVVDIIDVASLNPSFTSTTEEAATAASSIVIQHEDDMVLMKNKIAHLERQLRDAESRFKNEQARQLIVPKNQHVHISQPRETTNWFQQSLITTGEPNPTNFSSANMLQGAQRPISTFESSKSVFCDSRATLPNVAFTYMHPETNAQSITGGSRTALQSTLPNVAFTYMHPETNAQSISGGSRTALPSTSERSPVYNYMLPEVNTSTGQSRQHDTTMAPRKLQDLPEFSGKPEDWPVFYTSFVETTAAYKYTNLENNQRLNKCLKGEAKEFSKSLLIHPNNVNEVIQQLSFSYGRPEQLIRSQLKKIREVASISENQLSKLVPFATATRNLAVFLQSVNGTQHLGNPMLLEELVAKLPMSKRIEWARCAASIMPYPTVKEFSDWLSEIARYVCLVQDNVCEDQKRRTVLHATSKKQFEKFKCILCEGAHKIADCQRITNSTVPDRWTLVKRHHLCFSCMCTGHSTRNCRRRKPCGTDGCERMHHKLLHDDSRTKSATQQNLITTNRAVLSCSSIQAKTNKLLFRVVPVTLYGHSKKIDTYALFDEGSSLTLMDNTLVEELGLQGRQRKLDIQWFGGRSAHEPAQVVDLKISGLGMKKQHALRNVFAVSKLDLPMQSLHINDVQFHASSKRMMSLQSYTNAAPKLLIGLDHCHLGLPSESHCLDQNGPYAANTELGWVVFGPSKGLEPSGNLCMFISSPEDVHLHQLVADFFSTESFGVRASPPIQSEADRRARIILEATTVRVNDRFQTGLLWKNDIIKFPDNFNMAMTRLIGVERKMKRDKEFAKGYKANIDSYVEKGYARKLGSKEASNIGQKTWYLPHFPVINPNKPGKVRLVFDAAAEVGGISLNSQLLKGPQDYRPLPAILFHFREGAVAVCGDIKEMFHQVLIQQEDRCAQRFLWRDGDNTRPADVYEMVAMTFGAACSPCAAHYVKTTNALQYKQQFPRAVQSITDYHYVDDYVDSFSSVSEAITVSIQVRDIHKFAGFELCKFSSNSSAVIKALDGCEADIKINTKESLSSEKILGMYWQPQTDNFVFKIKFNYVDKRVINGSRIPTKREIMCVVMSIFDPLGLLSHFTVIGKMLIREVWKQNVRWDDPVPKEVLSMWEKFRKQLENVTSFSIPRHYFQDRSSTPQDLQLHIFVDASEDAFAAVAYWRARYADSGVEVSFICAKSKGSPLKILTIPRLELQAALLGTRLLKTILEWHTLSISRYVLWSDSKTVIKWIQNEHRRYKPFVAHRIAEILNASKPVDWRWIPTSENVADEATRLKPRVDFSPTSRWCTGPAFLKEEEEHWPVIELSSSDPTSSEDNEEIRMKVFLADVRSNCVDFSRFSSYMRLKRTIAWVLRFIQRCRMKRAECEEHGLTAVEIEKAEYMLFRVAQKERYSEELKLIESGQQLRQDNSLYKLSPYLDKDGNLRVNGRIDAASCLTYATKRPIILPPDHIITKLMIAYEHSQMKHQNSDAVICKIRLKFWIPRLRQVLRTIAANCFICKMWRAVPSTPIMGQLPCDRLTPYIRPFTYTGLDYFGPIVVSVGRRHEKRWIALFTCLTVRAIHLEVAYDLSTDACILAIRNFINRRGVPIRIRSDNGKNFVGTNEEATRFSEVFDCEKVQAELASRGIEWLFNCPANPSEGGVWERMVQCVKRVLRCTLKEVAPREHTMISFLVEAENIVNSRPLTHLPIDVDQEEPLTPNHFLLGSPNTANTPGLREVDLKTCCLRKQWRIARQLRDCFWKKWVAEYLPTLTRRMKWCQSTKPLNEGDLVFICDINIPRREWCRGRIVRVYPGTDGIIRRADVRTAKGLIQRAVSKLAKLDIDCCET